MKVGVAGGDCIGLVTGMCFAEAGDQVICMDATSNSSDRVWDLTAGSASRFSRVGLGGCCSPKDIRVLIHAGQTDGADALRLRGRT